MPSRTTVNFWLDCLLLVLFLLLSWVSLVIRFVFPTGPSAAGWSLWGRGFEWWSTLQFVSLCALAAAVLLHVMLHWNWVCGVIANWRKKRSGNASRPDSGTQTIWGVGLMIVILNVLGLGLAAAVLTVQAPAG